MKALEGLLVVTLERTVAAPTFACRLADAGAIETDGLAVRAFGAASALREQRAAIGTEFAPRARREVVR